MRRCWERVLVIAALISCAVWGGNAEDVASTSLSKQERSRTWDTSLFMALPQGKCSAECKIACKRTCLGTSGTCFSDCRDVCGPVCQKSKCKVFKCKCRFTCTRRCRKECPNDKCREKCPKACKAACARRQKVLCKQTGSCGTKDPFLRKKQKCAKCKARCKTESCRRKCCPKKCTVKRASSRCCSRPGQPCCAQCPKYPKTSPRCRPEQTAGMCCKTSDQICCVRCPAPGWKPGQRFTYPDPRGPIYPVPKPSKNKGAYKQNLIMNGKSLTVVSAMPIPAPVSLLNGTQPSPPPPMVEKRPPPQQVLIMNKAQADQVRQDLTERAEAARKEAMDAAVQRAIELGLPPPVFKVERKSAQQAVVSTIILPSCSSHPNSTACQSQAAQAEKRQQSFPPLKSLSVVPQIDPPVLEGDIADLLATYKQEEVKCETLKLMGQNCPPSQFSSFIQTECDFMAVPSFHQCTHAHCVELRDRCQTAL